MKTIKIFAAVVMASVFAGCHRVTLAINALLGDEVQYVNSQNHEVTVFASLEDRIANEIKLKYNVEVLQLVITTRFDSQVQGKVEFLSGSGEPKVRSFDAYYNSASCIVTIGY